MKVLIAVKEKNGLESNLSEHFGHCPFFAVFKTESKELSFVNNELKHNDPTSTPVDQIMFFNPDMIFSLGMGRKAINLFNEKNVNIRTGNFKTVKEVINNIDNLEILGTDCKH